MIKVNNKASKEDNLTGIITVNYIKTSFNPTRMKFNYQFHDLDHITFSKVDSNF